MSKNTKTVYRSSIDGKFITKKAADKNPKTSEKEKVSTGKKK